MTEEDAKKRWCPFARAHWSGGVESEYQGNRFFAEDGVTSDPSTACLASGCMAWRWVSSGHGYCGLAGPSVRFVDDEGTHG